MNSRHEKDYRNVTETKVVTGELLIGAISQEVLSSLAIQNSNLMIGSLDLMLGKVEHAR